MTDKNLRSAAIKLAHSNPSLRPYILSTLAGKSVFKKASMDGLNLTIEAKTAAEADEFLTRFKSAMDKTGAANFCAETGLCKGNLGLARNEMPVVEGSHFKDFVNRLKQGLLDISAAIQRGFKAVKDWLSSGDPKEDAVKVHTTSFDVTKLKATQREINADKAKGMADAARAGKFDPGKEPVLVSKDFYILDGHHRWAAQILRAAEDGIKAKMNGVQVDLPVQELLAVANAYTDANGLSRKDF